MTESENNAVGEAIASIRATDPAFLAEDVEDIYELIEAIIEGERWEFYSLVIKIPMATDLIVRIAGRSLNCEAMEEFFALRESFAPEDSDLESGYLDPNDIFGWCLAAANCRGTPEGDRYLKILDKLEML